MERPVAQGGLTHRSWVSGNLLFTIADRDDEAAIRALLRKNELGGWVRLSLERNSRSFGSGFGPSLSQAFIIARDPATGEAVGICERSVRKAFIDGEVQRLPYLNSLRVARHHRNRIRVLKGGFKAVRTLLTDPADLPYALTSVTSGNDAARRVLCAGLPGMPTYHPCGELSTFALRTAVRVVPSNIERANASDIPAIAVLLQRVYHRHDYAPQWSAADLEHLISRHGLRVDDILIVRHGPGVKACLAVWDQSAAKQTVVRGYAPGLAGIRPLLNLISPLTGLPRFPAVGQPLRQAYLSHVAVEDQDGDTFRALLSAGLTLARQRGFDVALTGFASAHPFCAVVRQRGALNYRSDLYLVHWGDGALPRGNAADRPPHPEIAIM